MRKHGIPVFGPGKAAAALEGSKAFAKRIMEAAGVPTGRRRRAPQTSTRSPPRSTSFGAPHVVKADGLAAGKGVLVTEDRDAALAHAEHYLQQGPVLVEEFLAGQEVSLFFLADGHDVVPLSPAQDYKRIGDGDTGPNTGGMGAYSPLPWIADSWGSEAAFVDEVLDTIALPTVRALEAEGTPFIGLLYCGLIVTATGVRVIEFNARFGDPETQVVLPRLETPLSALLLAAATGRARHRAVSGVLGAGRASSSCWPARATRRTRSPGASHRPRAGGRRSTASRSPTARPRSPTAASSRPAGACSAWSPAGDDFTAARATPTRRSSRSTSRAANTATTSPRGWRDDTIRHRATRQLATRD